MHLGHPCGTDYFLLVFVHPYRRGHRPHGPPKWMKTAAAVYPRTCSSSSELLRIGVIVPLQLDASTEGAWLYQPRPSAWVLRSPTISQGCRPELSSPACHNRRLVERSAVPFRLRECVFRHSVPDFLLRRPRQRRRMRLFERRDGRTSPMTQLSTGNPV
jgi:hypothetical protein